MSNEAIGVKNIGPTHDTFSLPQKLVLFLSFPHLFPSLFTFSVEEAASSKKDCLSKNTLSMLKLDHPNLAKAARQYPEAIHCGCPKCYAPNCQTSPLSSWLKKMYTCKQAIGSKSYEIGCLSSSNVVLYMALSCTDFMGPPILF
jgi:hypothetical protein